MRYFANIEPVWQRIPVAVSCVCLGILLTSPPAHLSWILFTTLVLLAGVEKLAATANTVAVERDWVRLSSNNRSARANIY